MQISDELHETLKSTLGVMETQRSAWNSHWLSLSQYYLPRRYSNLGQRGEDERRAAIRNEFILDGTGTMAARVLSAGMMNGITSPARPWFRLRLIGFDDEMEHEARIWLDEVERRMLRVMAESNFYNALAVMYLELAVFGTSTFLLYEDDKEIIRCYNSPIGEYFLGQSHSKRVDMFGRKFSYKLRQIAQRWKTEDMSKKLQAELNRPHNKTHLNDYRICHLIVPSSFHKELAQKTNKPFVEIYWEESGDKGEVLQIAGYNEYPGISPRWDTVANDVYGSSCPGMDALADVIQLQHETKAKGQILDGMRRPPIVADARLKGKPTALVPGGITYVDGESNVGVKPLYTNSPPYAEISNDIGLVQRRIQEIFHNDLFRMISQLDTVRSATEIDARREEKLVLLGPVLDRFENEALDPAIQRIYSIMGRAGLLPPAPESIQDKDIEIQYVSMLSNAQLAVSTVPIERFLAFTGEIGAAYPEVADVPNPEELAREYAKALGVPAKGVNSRDAARERREGREEQFAAQEAAQTGTVLVDAAQQLSQTDVGGGRNALQTMLE
jgi:hypothetical protein